MSTKTKKSQEQVDDPLLSIGEAATYLGMTPRWVRGQLEEDKLPFIKLGRLVRFRKSHLDRYIEENTRTPEDGS